MVTANRQISHHQLNNNTQNCPLASLSIGSLLEVGTGRQFIRIAAILLRAVVWFLTGTLGVVVAHFSPQRCTMACGDNGKAAATRPHPSHHSHPPITSPNPPQLHHTTHQLPRQHLSAGLSCEIASRGRQRPASLRMQFVVAGTSSPKRRSSLISHLPTSLQGFVVVSIGTI